MVVTGVQYQPNSARTRTIKLDLHGTLHRSLFGKLAFDGTVEIDGATIANRDNGRPVTIVLNQATGGDMMYTSWHPLALYDYGAMFANQRFNEFTILEFRPHGGGWNGQNGLTIAAPAHTRSQALRLSNELMRRYLDGYRLK